MKFIEKKEDGTFIVHSKNKEYHLQEQKASVFRKAREIGSKDTNLDLEDVLIMKSLTYPEMNESDFLDLPGSTWTKLIFAIKEVYGLNEDVSEYITEQEDGTYKIHFDNTTYTLEEQSGQEVKKSIQKEQKKEASMHEDLLKKSLKEDINLENLEGSHYAKLHAAITHIYELQDFLE